MKRSKLLVLLASLAFAPNLPAWDYISPDSLNSLISRSAIPFLLDVREHDDYLSRHIPGAALYTFSPEVLEKRYRNLPSDRPLIVICTTGGSSALAAAFLELQQDIDFFDIFVLEGGMDLWNYDVVINDQRSFSQDQVLCELFSTSTCDLCFAANHYLDTEFLYSTYYGTSLFSMPRYRISYPEPLPDISGRDKYYDYVPVPGIVINGTEVIDPLDLTFEYLSAYRGDPTQFNMDIYGTVTGSDSHFVDLRVELEAGPTVDTLKYNLFILITQDSLKTDFWDTPFFPINGETVFNGTVRDFVESDTGRAFTIQPGETRFFDRTIVLDKSYSLPLSRIISFVQNLDTRKVFQVDNRMISQLVPFNSAPEITSIETKSCFAIYTGDTLSVDMAMRDSDQHDKVTPALSSFFSRDSITYEPYSSPEIILDDSTFIFTALESPVGNYRFDIVVTDRWALSDTLTLHVSVSDTASAFEKCCDFSGNSVVDILDVISFLLMLRNNPQNPRLDWNHDGRNSIIDAIELLLDIRWGKCPIPPGAGGLLASAAGSDFYPIGPGSLLDSDDIEWLKSVIVAMDLDGKQLDALMAELSAFSAPASLPSAYSLTQNSPNPFNPATTIRFSIPEGGADVSLRIYDLRGRLVRVLVDGRRNGGEHTVFFDGHNGSGRQLPSGVYLYRLISGEFTVTRKMLLLK